MNDLAELQTKLEATNSMLTQIGRAVAAHPNDLGINLNYKSLLKRQRKYEAEFLEAAESLGVDVCAYRLIPEGGGIKVTSVARALDTFQTWYSVLVHSIANGPHKRKSVPAEIEAMSSLGYAYAYPGSAGFMLTINREYALFEATPLEQAMQGMAEMVAPRNANALREFSAKYGTAAVSAMFDWAKHHAKSDVAADIDWRRGGETVSSCFVQPEEFRAIRDIILQTSEVEEERFEVTGMLVGADYQKQTFHFETPAGDVKGRIDPDLGFSEDRPIELPKRYKAIIVRRTTFVYATEEEKISDTLIRLNAES